MIFLIHILSNDSAKKKIKVAGDALIGRNEMMLDVWWHLFSIGFFNLERKVDLYGSGGAVIRKYTESVSML